MEAKALAAGRGCGESDVTSGLSSRDRLGLVGVELVDAARAERARESGVQGWSRRVLGRSGREQAIEREAGAHDAALEPAARHLGDVAGATPGRTRAGTDRSGEGGRGGARRRHGQVASIY